MSGFGSTSRSWLAGERVIWTGEPGHGLALQPMDSFLIPLSLIWCGFAILWTFGATEMGAPDFFTLWGLMFVAFGLYFVFGRFLTDMWLRGSLTYTLTNRRIFIERSGMFPKQTVVSVADLPPTSLHLRRSGRGTIRIGEAASMWSGSRGFSSWSPALDPTPQLLLIENAQHVFDLIQRAQEDANRGS